MHTTIGFLKAKPQDFKNCLGCGAFNWYENRECIMCGITRFRATTEAEIDRYIEAREIDRHFCFDCEIDV